MATIKNLLDRVIRLDTDDAAFRSLDDTSAEISAANREQLLDGGAADGGEVGLYRNEQYAEMKFRMNPRAGFGKVDLRLTGAFQNSIVTNVIGDTVITESTDEKTEKLRKKYGDDIFGLNSTFRAKYIAETLRPDFTRRLSDLTGLKFK